MSSISEESSMSNGSYVSGVKKTIQQLATMPKRANNKVHVIDDEDDDELISFSEHTTSTEKEKKSSQSTANNILLSIDDGNDDETNFLSLTKKTKVATETEEQNLMKVAESVLGPQKLTLSHTTMKNEDIKVRTDLSVFLL